MIIYLCIFVFVLFMAIFYDGKKYYGKKDYIYFFLYIIIVCLMGFSRELGADKFVYIEEYKNCITLDAGSKRIGDYINLQAMKGYLPLWTILNIVIKTIYPSDFYLFQFVHAAFVNGVIFYTFKRYSYFKYRCLIVYFIINFFILNCETMRESMAISIFLLSYPYLVRKKWLIYSLLCVVAVLFHYSALILVILPFVPNIKTTPIKLIGLMLVGVILFYTANGLLLSLSESLVSFDYGGSRYANYLMFGGNFNLLLFNYFSYVVIPYIFYWIYLTEKSNNNIQELKPLIQRYFIVAPIIAALLTFNRVFSYFSIFAIILFVDSICHSNRHKDRRIIGFWLSLVVLGYFISAYFRTYGDKYERNDLFFPYTSAFDNEPTKYRSIIHSIATQTSDRALRK